MPALPLDYLHYLIDIAMIVGVEATPARTWRFRCVNRHFQFGLHRIITLLVTSWTAAKLKTVLVVVLTARPKATQPSSYKSRCGAVAVGRTYLFPPLSSGGALVVRP